MSIEHNFIHNIYIHTFSVHSDQTTISMIIITLELVAFMFPKMSSRIVVLGMNVLKLTHYVIFPTKKLVRGRLLG